MYSTLQEWLLSKQSIFSLKCRWLPESWLQKHLPEIFWVSLHPFWMPLIAKFSHCVIKSVIRDWTHWTDTLLSLFCYRKLLRFVLSNWTGKKIISADKDKSWYSLIEIMKVNPRISGRATRLEVTSLTILPF